MPLTMGVCCPVGDPRDVKTFREHIFSSGGYQHTPILMGASKVMYTWWLLKWWAMRLFAILQIFLRPLVSAVYARDLLRPAVSRLARSMIHGEFCKLAIEAVN